MITIGVFATIVNEDGDVLCVQRNYPPFGWTTPGGRLEDNESPEQGVIREVLEETGFIVSIDKLIGIYSAPFKSDLVISYLCKIKDRVHWEPNDEIADIQFFPISNLPSPMKNNTFVRISDALQNRVSVSKVFTKEEHA
ncbi:NADH pyrophosphatase [Acinetobacter oleivorans]|jgi:ADP-ribose pyrophosphatase YjhB (NUDIX family)|nr:NADH pyrophosphatase [Acinetobacter oleivorans]CAI3099298.1 NADH pyrophosphatase [Acinetobacter oleivorans]CAI3099313.1 NADH pyrophosphatase [Acinetobacter oleivorans]CAI3099337.1 NADH pyrophosphatase [Acinetobacter oleivorans]CAI3119191.1 NADH pyrophosphatase [Acinetobacter oleivorans]